MLFVLGVGSNIAMTSCVMTVIRDQFPSVKAWHAASGVTMIGLLIGFVYVTPVYKTLLREEMLSVHISTYNRSREVNSFSI